MKRMCRLITAAICAVVVFVPLASAQQGPAPAGKDALPSLTSFGAGDLWSSLGRLGITLVAVLALIWVTMWIAKRVLKGRIAGRGDSELRVMERLYLAPKKSIEVVSVAGRILVLGVTEHGISMLTELAEGDLTAAPGASPSRTALPKAQAQRQRDLLRQARTRMRDLFASARVTQAESSPPA